LEVTKECDPGNRMEDVASGLREALTPGRRGGVLAFAAAPGTIRLGDRIGIER
jgi:MOSC domain-containing protein YiiM